MRAWDLEDRARAVGVGDVDRVRGVVDDDGAPLARVRDQRGQLRACGGRAGRVVGRAEEDEVGAGHLRAAAPPSSASLRVAGALHSFVGL